MEVPTFMPLFAQLPDEVIQALRHVFRALAALAAIAPDVPVVAEAPGFAVGADVGADLALVVAVVPFTDGLANFNVCVCADVERGLGRAGGGVVPWVVGAAAEVEEFEGALSACAGGYVALWGNDGVSLLLCDCEGYMEVGVVTCELSCQGQLGGHRLRVLCLLLSCASRPLR